MSDQFPVAENTSSAVTAFAGAAAQNYAPEKPAMAGGFLKFSGKTGAWEMGKEEEDFKGVEALIDSVNIQHGFIRWGTKPPAKNYVVITKPIPTPPLPFDGVDEKGQPKTHFPQPSRVLVGHTNDEHKDAFMLELGSMGGVENIDKLIAEILVKAGTSICFFPVVVLGSEFYTRATGKVFKPTFKVIQWCDEHGNPEGTVQNIEAKPAVEAVAEVVEPEPEVVEPEAPVKKKRTRRTPAKA
jgi:hypothetical protein